MTTGKKITIGAVIVIVVLVVAVAIAVPLLLDVDRYRPEVVQHIRAETGKPAAIGHLSLTVFPTLSVRVDDLALGNPAGFPEGAFLRVRSISAQLDAGALWNREVLIKSLQLNDPVINLLSDVRGRWNFENAPEAKARKVSAGQDKPMFTLGVIAKLAIEGAQVTATNLLPSGRPGPAFFQARGVSSQLEQVHLNAFAGSASAWPSRPPIL